MTPEERKHIGQTARELLLSGVNGLVDVLIAADIEIEQLRAENERLRAALAQYRDRGNWDGRGLDQIWLGPGLGPNIARDALEAKP